jgi:hypothetical protein
VDFAAVVLGRETMSRVQRPDFLIATGAILAAQLAAEAQEVAMIN